MCIKKKAAPRLKDNGIAKRPSKDKAFKCQLQTIFHFLQEHIATASMVSATTEIPQKNITRYIRDLEKAPLSSQPDLINSNKRGGHYEK